LALVARALSREEEQSLRAKFLALLRECDSSSHRGMIANKNLVKVMCIAEVTSSADKAANILRALGCDGRGGLSFCDFVAASLAQESAIDVSETTLRIAFGRFESLGSNCPGLEDTVLASSYGTFARCVRNFSPLSLLKGDLGGDKNGSAPGSFSTAPSTPRESLSRSSSRASESENDDRWKTRQPAAKTAVRLPTIIEPTSQEVNAFVTGTVANSMLAWLPVAF